MQTILDTSKHWFLCSLNYQRELEIVLAEGIVSDRVEELRIGEHVLNDLRPIEVTDQSRLFVVRFKQFVAWQVVDESFTALDTDEERDDTGTIQTLTRSKYLDFINTNHGWFEDTIGPAKHYRVLAADDVIDVVASNPPIVEQWHGKEPHQETPKRRHHRAPDGRT